MNLLFGGYSVPCVNIRDTSILKRMGKLTAQPPASRNSVKFRFLIRSQANIAIGTMNIAINTAIQIRMIYSGNAEIVAIPLAIDLNTKLNPAPTAARLKPPASIIIAPLLKNF